MDQKRDDIRKFFLGVEKMEGDVEAYFALVATGRDFDYIAGGTLFKQLLIAAISNEEMRQMFLDLSKALSDTKAVEEARRLIRDSEAA